MKPKNFFAGMLLFLMAAMGCVESIAEPFLPPLPEGRSRERRWQDEFSGDIIDPGKWEVIGENPRRDGFRVHDDAYLDGRKSGAARGCRMQGACISNLRRKSARGKTISPKTYRPMRSAWIMCGCAR